MKRKQRKASVLAVLLAAVLAITPAGAAYAAEGQKLTPTDNVRKFDLGSADVGGTGVEGTSNWIKIVQNSNKKKLFEDVPKGTDVAAIQVTFEISNWSGVQFPITWGCNINFAGDGRSTWCGTAMYEGFSTYVIDREGEFTVTCDFATLCKQNNKTGIEWLQTCEMVIGNLTEGDKTMIEIKDAVMYLPGETVPADNATKTGTPPAEPTVPVDTIAIDPMNMSRTNGGVFEGWGTSLCWYGNRIGGSEQASNQAAELLYNSKTGLGLNIIRYNVGGGDDPTHTHIQRSDSNMPGYWTNVDVSTGTFDYDFTKDANQRNVLLKSIEQCPDMLVEMFSNSAPYFMTRSGCTSGTTDNVKSNITLNKMSAFADYMATVVKHYVDEGINVVSLEPMNEPSNGWNVSHYGVKQEGCSVEAGSEQSAMISMMHAAMEKHGLSDIALAGCDETNDTTTNQSIKKMSADSLALLDQINTHTYSRNAVSSQKLYKTALELNKKLWMTETDNGGVLGDNAGEMGAALNFASQITADLNNLQPSAWIMWQAIGSYCDVENQFDPDSLDQKTLDTNGFWGVCYADMNEETIVKTKKYYGFGQYTKYIRPGDTLIATKDGKTTAAYSAADGQVKIVTYNTSSADREVSFDLTAFENPGTTVSVIRTSGDYASGENWAELENLKVEDGKIRATIKGNSITTFVVDGVSHDMAVVLEALNQQTEEPEETTEVKVVELVAGRPIPAVDSVTGRICFASSDWSYTVMENDATTKTGITVSTMENGSYSLTLPAPGGGTTVIGATVFCMDLVGYAKELTGIDATKLKTDAEMAAYNNKVATTVRATVTSVVQDGVEMDLNAAKVVVGDTEANGNLRIELYNMYGPTAEDAAVEPDAVEFVEALTINFTIELADLSATEKVEWTVEEPVETPVPTVTEEPASTETPEPTPSPAPTEEPTAEPTVEPTEVPEENEDSNVNVSGNVSEPKSNTGIIVATVAIVAAVLAVAVVLVLKKKK